MPLLALVLSFLLAAPHSPPPAHSAESGAWVESPSTLTAPYIASSHPDVLTVRPIAIREGQQDVWFYTGRQVLRLEVCVIRIGIPCDENEEPGERGWNTLYDAGPTYQHIPWTESDNLPEYAGSYQVRMRYTQLHGANQI